MMAKISDQVLRHPTKLYSHSKIEFLLAMAAWKKYLRGYWRREFLDVYQ